MNGASLLRAYVFGAALLALCGCVATGGGPGTLATARSAGDFDSYRLHRVGLLPFGGEELDAAGARTLQQAFLFELALRSPYEIVALDPSDLAEVAPSRPYERGCYDPRTVLEIARRFQLDGMLVGTVTQMQVYAPQMMGLEIELVASETGQVIWWSRLQLDASDRTLRAHLERFRRSRQVSGDDSADLQLTLLSPSRLARFAAYEVALTL